MFVCFINVLKIFIVIIIIIENKSIVSNFFINFFINCCDTYESFKWYTNKKIYNSYNKNTNLLYFNFLILNKFYNK